MSMHSSRALHNRSHALRSMAPNVTSRLAWKKNINRPVSGVMGIAMSSVNFTRLLKKSAWGHIARLKRIGQFTAAFHGKAILVNMNEKQSH